jgi:hypothetical protein
LIPALYLGFGAKVYKDLIHADTACKRITFAPDYGLPVIAQQTGKAVGIACGNCRNVRIMGGDPCSAVGGAFAFFYFFDVRNAGDKFHHRL